MVIYRALLYPLLLLLYGVPLSLLVWLVVSFRYHLDGHRDTGKGAVPSLGDDLVKYIHEIDTRKRIVLAVE